MPKQYSHVSNFTGYSRIVLGIVNNNLERQKILDIPAGNGLLAIKLRESGHDVICADINREKKDYVFADMSETLPFDDEEFDTVICLEGLEHLLEPAKLISELCRICKNKGRIIVSLPNIQNMYSKFQFMCTGTFYQFPPLLPLCNIKNEEKMDLGHISPLSYVQLRYLFKYYGGDILSISGDKYKRKVLLPILSPFILLGYLWFKMFKEDTLAGTCIDNKGKYLFRLPLLFSRSLILVFEKK
jgi:SAM-dependent methyltransferase